jgi:hypothetical protein
MIPKVFLKRKIFGEISVEYLGEYFWKEFEGSLGEIFRIF